jgi:hypothetical protein
VSVCECGLCHEVFAGLTLFDRHQDVDYHRPHADVVRCLDPAALGMVRNRHGHWGSGAQNTRFPSSPSISAGLTGSGAYGGKGEPDADS